MAYIGLYGVYYSKATLSAGVLTGYNGIKTMGKAISASFEPADTDDNPLYANNGIAETDARASAGGTITMTLDRLEAAVHADLFGVTSQTVAVTVDGVSVNGTGFDDTGSEEAAAVGVAYVRQKQLDNSRSYHEAVIYSYVTFAPPSEEAETLGESIEWQTPEIEGTVSGTTVTGVYPWRKRYTFPTQEAAVQFITDYFAAPPIVTT